MIRDIKTCPRCRGSGREPANWQNRCLDCEGLGYVVIKEHKTIESFEVDRKKEKGL